MSEPNIATRKIRVETGTHTPSEYLGGTCGGPLSPEDRRKIGYRYLRIWQHLVLKVRGWDVDEMRLAYKRVSLDLGEPEHVVKRAMARCREAGLVETRHERTRKGAAQRFLSCTDGSRVPDLVNTPNVPGELLADGVHYTSTLYVRVWGLRVKVRGGHDWWVPDATLAWCRQARGRGGARAGAGRPAWCGDIKLPPEPKAKSSCTEKLAPTARPALGNAGLRNQTALPLIFSSPLTSASPSEKAAAAEPAATLLEKQKTGAAAAAAPAPLPPELEQHYRDREHRDRFNGRLVGLRAPVYDARYYELRRAEITAGIIDPLDPRARHRA